VSEPSRLILVGGAPASGKTTLAERLAADLGYPLLTKDLIKESFFDALGSPDREYSKKLSLASYAVLYRVAQRLIEAGASHVLESNFQRGVSEGDLLPLVRRSRAILIHCTASTDALLLRYEARAAGPVRHPGHHDGPLTAENLRSLGGGIYEPLDLPVPILIVDTTDRYDPEYPIILEFARTGTLLARLDLRVP
jgi:predicted kinase